MTHATPATAQPLDGHVAVITGGAIGFGRAFARDLAGLGASIALLDVDGPAVEQTAQALREDGATAIALTADVADDEQVDAAITETVAELGGIDILINNAGKHLLTYNQPFTVLPRHEVRALFDVNVIGVVNCSVAAHPHLAASGHGSIINISSMAGHLTSTPYGVSKLAVRGLTVAFATEFAPDRIRVNALSPGLMATENALAGLPQDLIDEFVQERQLVHRLGTMDDIVSAMRFLCLSDSSFITGETLRVTGGTPLFV